MNTAKQALINPDLLIFATDVQFFNRSTVYSFADGSKLTVNMYGPSYAA